MTAATLVAQAQALVLASSLASYPDDDLAEVIRAAAPCPAAAAALAALDAPGGVTELRARYGELFDRGGQRASLYETEYGRMRGMGKGHALADIAGFYQAFGLTIDEARHEMLDHLAVELEFYAVLLLKQAALIERDDATGVAIVASARGKFLAEHLGALARAVAGRAEVIADPIYACVFGWCALLVDAECAALGVTPAPLDFFPDEDSRSPMKCGAVQLPVVS
jgi:nitrate reductase assembly molybdenum cofactor insertion protein NarJ